MRLTTAEQGLTETLANYTDEMPESEARVLNVIEHASGSCFKETVWLILERQGYSMTPRGLQVALDQLEQQGPIVFGVSSGGYYPRRPIPKGRAMIAGDGWFFDPYHEAPVGTDPCPVCDDHRRELLKLVDAGRFCLDGWYVDRVSAEGMRRWYKRKRTTVFAYVIEHPESGQFGVVYYGKPFTDWHTTGK